MIRFSDAPIARGARCPIKFTVYLRAPGCPAGCLACEPAVRSLLHYAGSSTYAQPTCARWPLWPPRVLFGTSIADSPAAERDRTALLFEIGRASCRERV